MMLTHETRLAANRIAECAEKMAAYWTGGKERENARSRARRAADLEKARAYDRQRRSSKAAKAAKRAYNQAYYQANKDRMSAYALAQREAHREELRAAARRYYHSNHEERKSANRRFQDRRNFGGLRHAVLKRDGYQCVDCRGASATRINIHHIDQDRRHNKLGNLVTLCASCHSKRHAAMMTSEERSERNRRSSLLRWSRRSSA